MTELVSGVSSPGLINALLLWQQVWTKSCRFYEEVTDIHSSHTRCYWLHTSIRHPPQMKF